ncbi:hypothetical protein HU200_051513 [Digitaria exilis]|uniref:Uncharacterized protein n=1 Tax=Digitaria exilis TaxID=1010633 RepID=A0A835AVA3_9POAL|nr:hypothetical protein HU200_051513 [Digitaria exilis]
MCQTLSIEKLQLRQMKSIRGKRRIENNVSGVQEKRLMKPSKKKRREIKSNVSTGPGVKFNSHV